MNKQDTRLALSVVAVLVAGITLIYTLIMFPEIIFAVAGIGLIFIIAAFILTQNILNYASSKEKTINKQIRDCVTDISNQLETMQNTRSQLDKATFLYTKQTAKTIASLENNYSESQEALYKNLTALSNAQNKSTKLMIKYDQSNTTKIISTLKDIRSQLNDTMSQGFDQIQPNNTEIVGALEDIVDYLKSQPIGMDQSMSLQLNNVAHELQNISNSIQQVQVPATNIPQMVMPAMSAVMQQVMETPEEPAMPETIAETSTVDFSEAEELSNSENTLFETLQTKEISAAETQTDEIPNAEVQTEEIPVEEVQTEEVPVEEVSVEEIPIKEVQTEEISAEEIQMQEIAEEPVTEDLITEMPVVEEPFTPTFTVVGKEDKIAESPEEPVAETPVNDDPNKQLSPDEIAALFAAADPAPKKEEKPAEPEPVALTPVTEDPNKQLSPDEIAALFAAADPAPKKEEKPAEPEPVAPASVTDDPNKQLSPDEIAALFASMG